MATITEPADVVDKDLARRVVINRLTRVLTRCGEQLWLAPEAQTLLTPTQRDMLADVATAHAAARSALREAMAGDN
jgi:hypothetical protein